MRSIGVTAWLLGLLAVMSPGLAAARTEAILSEADRTIGDTRHKLDLIDGQARIALSCRTTRPNVYAAAVLFAPDRNWPSEPISLEFTRGNGSAYKLIFNGSVNLLLAEGSAARELASWGMAKDTLGLRAEDAVAAFDLRRPQVSAALARYKKLCQI